MRRRPLEERFWEKVNKNGPIPTQRPDLGPCWQWIGGKYKQGYGGLSRGGTPVVHLKAHRVSYEMHVGPIPEGMVIDHLCRNTSCVNPAHLEPVTSRINTLRGNTFQARNAAKTHCIKGHPFDAKNTYPRKGGRGCRICSNEFAKQYRQRKQHEHSASN